MARDRELLTPEVSHEEVKAILLATTPNVGFFAAAIALAVVAPRAAAIGYLVVAAVGVLRVRGDQPALEPSESGS